MRARLGFLTIKEVDKPFLHFPNKMSIERLIVTYENAHFSFPVLTAVNHSQSSSWNSFKLNPFPSGTSCIPVM